MPFYGFCIVNSDWPQAYGSHTYIYTNIVDDDRSKMIWQSKLDLGSTVTHWSHILVHISLGTILIDIRLDDWNVSIWTFLYVDRCTSRLDVTKDYFSVHTHTQEGTCVVDEYCTVLVIIYPIINGKDLVSRCVVENWASIDHTERVCAVMTIVLSIDVIKETDKQIERQRAAVHSHTCQSMCPCRGDHHTMDMDNFHVANTLTFPWRACENAQLC